MNAEARLVKLGLELPGPTTGTSNRAGAVRSGTMIYTSGHGPAPRADGSELRGKVGADVTLEEGYEAGRLTGFALLATIQAELGSLDHVARVVKLLGLVNCAPGFNQTSHVVDGCSDLMIEVFGTEIGRHARSAVGASELPLDFPVEIEAIFEVAG